MLTTSGSFMTPNRMQAARTTTRQTTSTSSTMALRPAPSASSSARGETTIQPAHFTSSLFINALREDIDLLITTYLQSYANTDHRDALFNPYSSFKDVWKSFGWQWLHLKVIESRARDSFLSSVLRLFLGRSSTFPSS